MSVATLPKSDFDAQVALYLADHPLQLAPAVSMTQEQFFDLCQQNPEMHFERNAAGDLIIMVPSGGGAGYRNLEVGSQLHQWAKADGTGKAFDSSAGYTLPNGANRSPDASWVLNERLATLTVEEMEKFLPFCPDFAVEVMSPPDRLKQTQAKMIEYLANGMRLGWLIHPQKKQVYVYRPKQAVDVLDHPLTLSGDPELPGFTLDLQPIWQS